MAELLERFLCCHVCSETFKDPVSLSCNHSFCQECVQKYWEKSGNKNCPVCKRKSSKDNPLVNFSLKELSDTFAGRLHLGESSEEGSELICSKHSKTPSWFCVDEDKAVCDDCQNPTQHAGHKVIKLQEAVQEKQGKLKIELERMQSILGKCTKTEGVYKKIIQHTKSQLAATARRIREQFEQLHQFLREEEEARLAALREEEEQKGKRLDEEIKTLEKQIQTLKDSIQHVEKHMSQDNVSFLKGYQGAKNRVQGGVQVPQVSPGLLLDEAKHLGNLKFRVLEKMVDTVNFTPVTLDPNTAFGEAYLSDDLTSVRYSKPNQDLPDNPERFMKYVLMLGSEGFSSGRHCWDVQVGDRRGWTIGVAKDSVERKGETFLNPQYGIWALWKREDVYNVHSKTLSLKSQPERIRVQLDYDRGQVSFYDTRDMSHIYTYKDTFKERVFPFFGPQTDDSETCLQICPCKVTLKCEQLKV